jgi:ABC-type amino acid transport substrate-binding protein
MPNLEATQMVPKSIRKLVLRLGLILVFVPVHALPSLAQSSESISKDSVSKEREAQVSGAIETILQTGEQPKATLKVGIAEVPPFIMFGDGQTNSGYSLELWQTIAQELGVDTFFIRYYTLQSLLEAVEQGRVDLAISGIAITAERESKGLDFSYPIYSSGLQILTVEQDLSPSMRVIYNIGGWATVAAILKVVLSSLVVGVLVWLLERSRNEHFPNDPLHGIGQGIWFAIVTLGTFGYGDVVRAHLMVGGGAKQGEGRVNQSDY